VVHVGKLRRYKGSLDLVEAFGEVDRPDAHLLVAGEPETPDLAASLQEAARGDPRVHLDPRRLPEPDLADVLAAADIVALPYRRILTSGTLHLALANRRPVLAPRLGCLPWDLPDGAGHLYDPDADLADALDAVLDGDLLGDLARSAREASRPSLAEAVEPVVAAYGDAVD
jgi:glycosyltransferase involved in cell wall biosynthesis